MRASRSMLIAVVLAGCVLIPCLPADARSSAHRPDARSSAHRPLGGINLGGVASGESLSSIDAEVRAAHALHARLVRVELPWAQFQPLSEGQFDQGTVAVTDRLMRDAAAAHIKVIALIDRTPCWASTAPRAVRSACVPGQSGGGAQAWPPRRASSFGAFAAWLARRYRARLAAIEVWNEPDQANQHYLAGPEKPRHYAKLLRAAYPAIKRADPRVKVLAGSLVGSNGAFMRALYRNGIKGYYDGVAVHFYTLVLGSVRRFREVQLAHGDHKPLWLDEFGWTSCWPAQKIEQEQGCVTPAAQAKNITNAFRELASARYLAALLPYDLQDTQGGQFGVLTEAGKRKPSFHALAKALAFPLGPPSPITLRLRAAHGQIIASGSGPVGDYMRLEAFSGGRLRYWSIFTLNRFNRYSLKLPKALGTRGLTVRIWQYWLGPRRHAQRSI